MSFPTYRWFSCARQKGAITGASRSAPWATSPSRCERTACWRWWRSTSLAAPTRSGEVPRLLTVLQLAAVDLAGDFLQAALQGGVDAFHLQPDFRHHGLARTDLSAAHALRAQGEEPRPRRLLGAEHAERDRPVELPFVHHHEIIFDAQSLQLRGFFRRRLPVALRRNEDPPARSLLGAALAEAAGQRERLQRLLGLRRIRAREAAPFHARHRNRHQPSPHPRPPPRVPHRRPPPPP